MKNLIIIALLLTGCVGTRISTGIGYRKTPPELSETILLQSENRLLGMGVSPAQVQALLSLFTSDIFKDIIKQLVPEDNRVDVGLWFDIRID